MIIHIDRLQLNDKPDYISHPIDGLFALFNSNINYYIFLRIHRIYLTWPQHRCGHHCCGFETIDQIGVNNRDGLNCKPLYFLFKTCLRFMGQHNSSNIGSVKTLPLFGARPIRFLSCYGTQSVTYVAFGYTLHSLLIQSFKTKMASTFWF